MSVRCIQILLNYLLYVVFKFCFKFCFRDARETINHVGKESVVGVEVTWKECATNCLDEAYFNSSSARNQLTFWMSMSCWFCEDHFVSVFLILSFPSLSFLIWVNYDKARTLRNTLTEVECYVCFSRSSVYLFKSDWKYSRGFWE